jgi:hypothetical protein
MRPRAAFATLITASLVVALAVLPFVAAGTWPSYWRAVQRLGQHDLVSGTATNVWWIATWAAGSFERLADLGWAGALSRPATMVRISTVVAAGMPNPRTIGVILTAAALGWAAWRSRRGLTAPVGALVGAWCVVAYFLLSGQVHENHSYLALPLLGMAAAAMPRLRALYWSLTAAFVLNLYLFYGLGMTRPSLIDRSWTFIDMTVLVSVAYCLIGVWMTREVVEATRAPISERATVRG